MKTIHAIYENGIFRPSEPVPLANGAEVEVLIKEEETDAVAILKARFPGSFGGFPEEDGNEIEKIIEEEFEKIDPNDWK